MPGELLDDVRTTVQRWAAADDRDRSVRARTLALLRDDPAALVRSPGGRHVTASVFLVTRDLQHVALVFHRKGRFWVQPGGHLEEGDPTLAAAGLRELTEETGVAASRISAPLIADIDIHDLGPGFTCAAHYDIGLAAAATEPLELRASDESEAVGWFPVASLPADAAAGLSGRVQRAVGLLRAR